jgi:hypothetical protein
MVCARRNSFLHVFIASSSLSSVFNPSRNIIFATGSTTSSTTSVFMPIAFNLPARTSAIPILSFII